MQMAMEKGPGVIILIKQTLKKYELKEVIQKRIFQDGDAKLNVLIRILLLLILEDDFKMIKFHYLKSVTVLLL